MPDILKVDSDMLIFCRNARYAADRWKSAGNIRVKKWPALTAAVGSRPSTPCAIPWICGTKTTACSTGPISCWINAWPAVLQ